jgi:hypothetical protein
MQKITVLVIGAETKIRVVKALVGLADLRAERQENVSILIERNEFDRIPKIVAFRRIGQKAPILFITRKRIQWTRKRSRFFLSYRSIRSCNDHKEYHHLRDPEHCLHSALTRTSEIARIFRRYTFSASITELSNSSPEYCCCPAIRLNLQQGHDGFERNCWSHGKRLNLKEVSSCQTDEISPMAKNWTAPELRNLRERSETPLVNL